MEKIQINFFPHVFDLVICNLYIGGGSYIKKYFAVWWKKKKTYISSREMKSLRIWCNAEQSDDIKHTCTITRMWEWTCAVRRNCSTYYERYKFAWIFHFVALCDVVIFMQISRLIKIPADSCNMDKNVVSSNRATQIAIYLKLTQLHLKEKWCVWKRETWIKLNIVKSKSVHVSIFIWFGLVSKQLCQHYECNRVSASASVIA